MLFLAILGHFAPFLGPRGPTRVRPGKSFGQSLSFMGTYMCEKSEKSNGWLLRKSRTNGRMGLVPKVTVLGHF